MRHWKGFIYYVRQIRSTIVRTRCKLKLELYGVIRRGKKRAFGLCLEYNRGAYKILSAAKVPFTDAVYPGPWKSGVKVTPPPPPSCKFEVLQLALRNGLSVLLPCRALIES